MATVKEVTRRPAAATPVAKPAPVAAKPVAGFAGDSMNLKSIQKPVAASQPNVFERVVGTASNYAGTAWDYAGTAVETGKAFAGEQVERLSDAVRSTLEWLNLSRMLSNAADKRAEEEKAEKKKLEAAAYDKAVYEAAVSRNAGRVRSWHVNKQG